MEEIINQEKKLPLFKIKPLQKYEKTYNFREKIYDIKKGEKNNNNELYERNVEDNEG